MGLFLIQQNLPHARSRHHAEHSYTVSNKDGAEREQLFVAAKKSGMNPSTSQNPKTTQPPQKTTHLKTSENQNNQPK